MRFNETGCECSQQITDGISALQNSRKNASPLIGSSLHRERSAYAPLAVHADSIDRAQDEEHRVVRRKSAQKFDDGEKNYIRHQRNAAPIAVSQQSENNGADWAHGQCRCNAENNIGFGNTKLPGQCIYKKDNDKEVEGV